MNLKQIVAEKAVQHIKEGMVVGLGTGSTANFVTQKIGELVKDKFELVCIPTSVQTETLAKKLNIPLASLEDYTEIDITIDGADEVDPKLNLIKGMGGALLREKIIASYSKTEIIVVDSSKLVKVLGTKSPLPVEIVPFGVRNTLKALSKLGCQVKLRLVNNRPYLTDNQNYLVECSFSSIKDPIELEKNINEIIGVVENGLFIELADIIIVGSKYGVKELKR